jgi:cytochrome c oxidase cbb3-type subunit 3
MRTRTLKLLLLVACLSCVALSCKREERTFRVPVPDADPVYSVQLSTLHPGTTQPSTQPTTQPASPVKNHYEENAYALSEGQRLYSAYNCVGCHAHGGGGIGPPLMDDQWIYGYQPEQVFATIVQGRPNGMPSFMGRIPEYQVWQLAAYVRSMSGQARQDAAPGRDDHMKNSPPPNSTDPAKPQNSSLPKSAEMPL